MPENIFDTPRKPDECPSCRRKMKRVGKYDAYVYSESAGPEEGEVRWMPDESRAEQLAADYKSMRLLIEEFAGLPESDDLITVGCHCTNDGQMDIDCIWCRAKMMLHHVPVV